MKELPKRMKNPIKYKILGYKQMPNIQWMDQQFTTVSINKSMRTYEAKRYYYQQNVISF